MVELILPVVELAGGGGGVLWYVTNAHVEGGKHPHNQKRYMHELQNDVRFGEPSSSPRGFAPSILHGHFATSRLRERLHGPQREWWVGGCR